MRKLLTSVGIFVALCAPTCLLAQQQDNISTTFSLNGFSSEDNNGEWLPWTFNWGPAGSSGGQGVSDTLTVTVPLDQSEVGLMTAAQSAQVFADAELQQMLSATTMVDVKMTNVRVHSVGIMNSMNNAQILPVAVLTLKFDRVVYTYQALTPTGQKAGPPVSFSASFR